MVHGPPKIQKDEIENLFLGGKFMQIFDLVACIVFSSHVVDEKLEIKHTAMSNEAYNECGPCKAFLVVLANGYCVTRHGKSINLSVKQTTIIRNLMDEPSEPRISKYTSRTIHVFSE